MTLEGLNPNSLYDLALYGNRNAFADGVERFTLGGAVSATNSSSIGIINNFVTDLDTRKNQALGHIARWTVIDPGADGIITVEVHAQGANTNIAYLNALRLVEVSQIPEPSSLALFGLGSMLVLGRRRRKV